MELYILDDTLRRTESVEQFESLVWTERWSKQGDFVLEIDPALAEPQLIKQGTMLACDKSDRVMVITGNETSNNADGVRLLKVTGPSLESVMDNRPNNMSLIAAGSAPAPFVLGDGTTKDVYTILNDLFKSICVTNATDTTYHIPLIVNGTISSYVGAISVPSGFPLLRTEIDTLYNTIVNICDIYKMGFRLIRVDNGASSAQLYFEVYVGFDRTTSQTALDAVVFSQAMDNLTDTSEVVSTEAIKNTALVFSPAGSAVVYGNGASGSTLGFDKKVLIVDASDITGLSGTPLANALAQRGQEELAKCKPIVGFDGQIPNQTGLIYGTNYKLGDLVEKRADDGTRAVMRVTEQIFVSDKDGEKSYPTLTTDSLIAAGSWDAVAPNRTWDSYTTETWDSM